MEMIVDFPGGSRVEAHFGPHTVRTDQPVSAGGENSAPTPFDLFLASLATCAGIYVLGFCRNRKLPVEGIRLSQRVETDPVTKMVKKILLDIQLPPDFPEQYKAAVIRAAEQCKVKKHFEKPPVLETRTSVVETIGR